VASSLCKEEEIFYEYRTLVQFQTEPVPVFAQVGSNLTRRLIRLSWLKATDEIMAKDRLLVAINDRWLANLPASDAVRPEVGRPTSLNQASRSPACRIEFRMNRKWRGCETFSSSATCLRTLSSARVTL